MKLKMMKKSILSIALLCATWGAVAQSLTSYYVPNAVERNKLNVAFAPEQGYIAIPLVGSTSVGLNGNISLSSLLYKSQNGGLVTIFDGDVSSSEALSNLHKGANFTTADNRIGIINIGSYFKDQTSFWSVNVDLRTTANVSLPYELFEFAKLGEPCTITDINAYMDSYVDIGFGYSRVIDDRLTVGGRAKLLLGVASASVNVSKIDISMSEQEWTAQTAGEVEVYGAGLTNADAVIGDQFDFDNLSLGGFQPAGYGFAVDLGAEYAVTDRLKVSLSANDIGFISWSESCNASSVMDMTPIVFSGVEIDGDGNTTTPDFNFDDMAPTNVASKGTTRFLQANLNVGGEYSFLDDLIGVGALYNLRLWQVKSIHTFALSGNVRPVSWFTFAADYQISNVSNSLGLALNFTPSWFNFYLASDILLCKKSAQFIPINQTAMNLTLGLSVPFGATSQRRGTYQE